MVEQTDNITIYTIQELRDIVVPFVEQRGFKWARLFGSYARGDASGTSDVDVLVDRGDARAIAVCGLANHIYQATGKRADVFDINELEASPFRDSVLRDAVAL